MQAATRCAQIGSWLRWNAHSLLVRQPGGRSWLAFQSPSRSGSAAFRGHTRRATRARQPDRHAALASSNDPDVRALIPSIGGTDALLDALLKEGMGDSYGK